jgi:ribulose-phosphate 3-epimerase
MALVVPAVLPSSLEDLKSQLRLLNNIPSITRVQIDVVDGRFATPASWPYRGGVKVSSLVGNHEMLPDTHRIGYEIDLMCFDAEAVVGGWIAFGASRLTFHAESVTDLPRLLSSFKKRYGGGSEMGLPSLVSVGLALNIASDLALIEQNVDSIEYVQFMGIAQIGQQGQPFDRRALEKIRIFHTRHPGMPIQVDGGVSLQVAKELLPLGVCNLVIGSAISRARDPIAVVAEFEALQTPFGV